MAAAGRTRPRLTLVRRIVVVLFGVGAVVVTLATTALAGGNTPTFEWANAMGDSGRDTAFDVAVDSAGNSVSAGVFNGTVDFDPGPAVANLTSAPVGSGFLVKYGPDGGLVWVKGIGAAGLGTAGSGASAQGVEIGPGGEIYVVGAFTGTVDFDPGPGSFPLKAGGASDAYAAKYDGDGDLLWAVAWGASVDDLASDVVLDPAGVLYISGTFAGTVDFDPGMQATSLTSAGGSDAFVSALDTEGMFAWAGALGGPDSDFARALAFDPVSGRIVVTGEFLDSIDLDPGSGTVSVSSAGSFDAFLVALDNTGGFIWGQAIGGSEQDSIRSVAVAPNGELLVSGIVVGEFGIGRPRVVRDSIGGSDILVARLDAAGAVIWSRVIGSAGTDLGIGLDIDPAGDVVVTGVFADSVDFDLGLAEAIITSPSGGFSGFLLRLSSAGDFVSVGGISATRLAVAYAVTATGVGETVLAGEFDGTVDFDPGTDEVSASSAMGSLDAFVMRLVSTPDTVGLVDPSQGRWHLRNSAGEVTSFFFGNPSDVPFVGDWDCDGDATPGLFRQSDAFVYLSNANRSQVADIRFFFGNPGDLPIAGDFNGDGCDTVSIYRPSEGRFFIINELGQNEGGLGAAETDYLFGDPGDKPFVGDFDGDGVDTVGLHRESTGLVYFRNSHTQGTADAQFIFGDPGDRLVAGDWGTVDGVDTPALFRPSTNTFFFRHTNTAGNADSQFILGETAWLPVAGAFGLG